VNILERRVENQVQFWSLLGPFVILSSIAVLLFKVSAHWVFPISALIGVPLCVKWKLKGMAAALGCLFAFSTTTYFGLEMNERYWHVGMGLAIAFSFIVLTLSLEEVEGLIGQLQMESQSRLENFTRLDEKWKGLELEWINDKEKLQVEAITLTRDLTKIQEDKQTFYKLAQLAKDELIQIRTQHDQLVQELLYKKQQIAQFHERLEENEATIQGFVNSNAEQQIQQLHDQLALLERDKELFKTQVHALQSQLETYQEEKDQWKQDLEVLIEQDKAQVFELAKKQQEKAEQHQIVEKLQNTLQQLEQDNLALIASQAHLKQQYEQVCQIEGQHRQTIQFQQHCANEFEKKLAIQEQHNQTYQKHQITLESSLQQHAQMLKDKEETITHLKQASDQVNQTLIEKQAYLVSVQEQMSQLQQALQAEQLHKIAALEQIQALKQAIDASNQDLMREQINDQQAQQQISELQQALVGEQLKVKIADQQIQQLELTKSLGEQRLIEIITQLQKTQVALEEMQKQPQSQSQPVIEENSGSKRHEALYLQLRDQFQEKSNTLEMTRRELFHVQEKLAVLQKTQEEAQLFEISAEEHKLQRLLHQLSKQYDKMESIYQAEMNELYDLIDHVFEEQAENKAKNLD
jgi:hypothetical protein